MSVKANKKIAIFILATIFMLTLSVGLLSRSSVAKADTVTLQTVTDFYDEYKDFESLKSIDPYDNFFSFYEQYTLMEDSSFYQKMQDLLAVAVSYDSLKSDFSKDSYDVSDWLKIEKIIQNAGKDVTVTDGNFVKDELLSIISKANSSIVSNYQTKEQKFDALKVDSISEIEKVKNSLLEVNEKNPDGSVETTVGFYDSTAKTDVEETAEARISDIEQITFETENSSDLVKQYKTDAINALKAIEPNDIVRAVNMIMDYYAIDADPEATEENKNLLKNSAREFCSKVKENLLPLLSTDVRKDLSAKISMIEAFPSEDFIPSDFEENLGEVIQTEDGAVVIRAVLLGEEKPEPIKVFPNNAIVKVYDSANGAGKQNASKSIQDKNKELSVAYFTYIDIWAGSTEWTPITQTAEGAKVSYQVEIDLNKYYSNYVNASGDGLLENLFKNVSFLQSKVKSSDKVEEIFATEDYIKDLADKTGSSLMYYYSKGETTALNYTLNDGGILMFETSNFGTFASASNAGGILTNPILWIAIALVIVLLAIIILVLILRNVKYTFKFETFGGTKVKPVKAKLGDVFPMPDDPTKEGFIFGGWYLDADCTKRFIDTSVKKRKGQKVFAKWHEENLPEKIVKYYEALRNEILCYGKVGALANTGLQEKEVLAKLFAENEGVSLNVALPVKRLTNAGYDVEVDDENPQTPALFIVNDKQTLKEGKEIIAMLMGVKGLQNIGPNEEPEPMSIEERQKGFVFAIENDRVVVSLSDYFEYLRVYANSFAVFSPAPGLEDGAMLTRMYLDKDCINLYLALSPRGSLVDASEKFEDTPALFQVRDNIEDVQRACDYIDKVMSSNGLERRNENSNGMSLKAPKRGCGCGYQVTLK